MAALLTAPLPTILQPRENTKEVQKLVRAILTASKPHVVAAEGDAFGEWNGGAKS